MLKSGVPKGAVNQKMTQESISQKDRNLVLGICEETEESKTPVAQASVAPEAAKGPKFVGLHWDPIHSKDQQHVIQKSIWGEISNRCDGEEESLKLAQEEYLALSSLFAKKDPSVGGDSSSGDQQSQVEEMDQGERLDKKKPSLKRRGSMPTTIDMSRSTNISIGLSSFKQKKMTIEMVPAALYSLLLDLTIPSQIIHCLNHFDVASLGQEDLLRLQEILPTENEVKTLQVCHCSDPPLHTFVPELSRI